MRYDDQVIRDVQSANDIVDVISQYIPLKRAGRNLKALCPFHSEKSPSFMVQPEKQIFHCFGCGAGGDVFSFVMRHENLTFPEVLRMLADRANVRLPEPARQASKDTGETEKLYEIYRQAAEYYEKILWSANGAPARQYLKQRGISEEMAREFGMGWAAAEWQGLLGFLTRRGYKEDFLLRSGLIHRSAKGRLYDAFRSRLLFPIRNLQGKTIGFGGRLVGQDEGPKYLNSPETAIFRKRRELFGLDKARRHIDRQHPRICVVEGYMDFLSLYIAGFRATVATLGTSLTNDHVRVLKRFAEEAIVIYDGDPAGEAAALRGLEIFLEEGMNVKLVRLPAGLDPDDLIKKQGKEALAALLDQAKDFFDYKLESLNRRYNKKESLGLMKMTNEILETLNKVQNPILLDHYIRRLTLELQLDENSIRSELNKLKQKGPQPRDTPSAKPSPPRIFNREEILLLAFAAEESRFRELLCRSVGPDDFRESATRDFFETLKQMKPDSTQSGLSLVRDESLKNLMVSMLVIDRDAEARDQAFEDCLDKIKKRNLQDKLSSLRRKIAEAEKTGDSRQLEAYLREYQALLGTKA